VRPILNLPDDAFFHSAAKQVIRFIRLLTWRNIMHIVHITRLGAAVLLAAGSLALTPAAHATCVGQYGSNHAEHGEKPCYPDVAPASHGDAMAAQDKQEMKS
jgi:hypothetical protein